MEFSRQEYWHGLPCPSSKGSSHSRDQGLFHCGQILYHLSHQGSPDIYKPLNKHGRFYYYYYIIISHKENTPGDGKHGPWGLADVAWGFLVIPEPRLSMKREHGCCRN